MVCQTFSFERDLYEVIEGAEGIKPKKAELLLRRHCLDNGNRLEL
jgi:hypothetical protein